MRVRSACSHPLPGASAPRITLWRLWKASDVCLATVGLRALDLSCQSSSDVVDSAAGSGAHTEDAPSPMPLVQPVDWGLPMAVGRYRGQRWQRQCRAGISPEPDRGQKRTRYLAVDRTEGVYVLWNGVSG